MTLLLLGHSKKTVMMTMMMLGYITVLIPTAEARMMKSDGFVHPLIGSS